jgi:hypothetical protein
MTEQEMRKGGGSKLSRSETVTVRLDPKLRYLAELASRLHRRTLSSYIEWTIKESLDSESLHPGGHMTEQVDGKTIGGEAESLWDVDEADRFAKLALRYPHLLTHEEQVLWKLIGETSMLWGESSSRGGRALDFVKLRRNWGLINQAAAEGRDGNYLDFEMN